MGTEQLSVGSKTLVHDGLPVTLHFAEVSGLVRVVRVDVGTLPSDGEVSALQSKDIRGVPFGRLIARALNGYAESIREMSRPDTDETDDDGGGSLVAGGAVAARARKRLAALSDTATTDATQTGRPRMYEDGHYREVAAVYMEAHRTGQPPSKAVAARFKLAPSAARKQVYTTRRRGYLPPTTPRKANAF
jgi:hypothetical protein